MRMRNNWKRITAIILSIVIVVQSISWDGIHSAYTVYAEDMDTTGSTETANTSDMKAGADPSDRPENSSDVFEDDQEPDIGNPVTAPVGSPLSIEGGIHEGSLSIYQDTYLTDDLVIEGGLNLYPFSLKLNGH